MFGDHPLGGKRSVFVDTALPSSTVSAGYGLQKVPSHRKKQSPNTH